MIITTLDAMMRRGLHDHLQGGFYRYTVDQEWQIPHFEKMLYDQALLLWNYSLAARQFERTDYRAVAQGIFRCLEETFAVDGLYASGHDADTEHEEGATYVWSLPELEEVLGDDELKLLRDHYEVSAGGNFEGRNHLIRRTPDFPGPPELRSVEETLLAARKKRPQPSRDGKLICSWNALAAVALFAAGRAGIRGATDRALEVTELLVERFTDGSSVSHSYTPGSDATGPAANHRFLSDHAALMLLLTFASGEAPEVQQRYRALLAELRNGIDAFRVNSVWIENLAEDFHPVPADPYDQPAPSGISLAQMALLRHALINHEEHGVLPFGDAQGEAFGNLVSLMSRGLFYVVESPEPYPPESLPVNSMSIYGEARTTCFRGICYLGPPKKEAADA
jgi:hypothetical protein